MVVGGYNTEKELLTDVEVISGEANNVCSKNVRPIYGRVSYFQIGDHILPTKMYLCFRLSRQIQEKYFMKVQYLAMLVYLLMMYLEFVVEGIS